MFKQDILNFIDSKRLFTLKDKVLIALSGGADSVALLRILVDAGYKCEAAHCNFHLRGEESDRDEMFVTDLCSRLEVPLHVVHFNTVEYAANNKLSIEMAARELRYNWFETIRRDSGAEVIAVAHHQDDSVETFLLNLVRGAGVNGLKGIAVKNGWVVRPMLNVTRKDILDYLDFLKQDFVTDSTNLEDEYMRNKIRLNILPMLKELNSAAPQKIAETAERMADVAMVYNACMEQARERVMDNGNIVIERLLEELVPQALLFEILYPMGFNGSQVKDVFASIVGQPGKRFLSEKYEVVRDRDMFIINRRDEEIAEPRINVITVDVTADFVVPRNKEVCCIDADMVNHHLTIRRWKQGDKFVPFGMKGKKNVSDYLTDRKLSIVAKQQQYVVCCGERIVWLVNERTDDRFRVTEDTKRVMIITVK